MARIDKWLWSVRVFKTRTLATDACKAGKVKLNGNSLKASYSIKINDVIVVKKDSFNLSFKVVQLLEKRVSATLAAAAVENITSEEEMNKFKSWFAETRDRGAGRPTKRERRDIDDYKVESVSDATATPITYIADDYEEDGDDAFETKNWWEE
jgi:ribosome-associated heat shock protein Hsp15